MDSAVPMTSQPEDLTDRYRRRFLAAIGAGAVAGLAPGLGLVGLTPVEAHDGAVTDSVRWGMMVNTAKCSEGCTHCVDACEQEHALEGFDRPRTDAQWIRKLDARDRLSGQVTSLPMLCQHCTHPPCVDVCPTGASFRRADGIVLVNKHTCIGCRYCMMACPYNARSFVHEDLTNQYPWSPRGKGTVESCTFCVHRVDQGVTPACVVACEEAGHGALVFGDLNDPDSAIARRAREVPGREVRADLKLDTGVRYEGV
jgi:tetrathionate reductase subunit B